jgi:hypothetical protein
LSTKNRRGNYFQNRQHFESLHQHQHRRILRRLDDILKLPVTSTVWADFMMLLEGRQAFLGACRRCFTFSFSKGVEFSALPPKEQSQGELNAQRQRLFGQCLFLYP